MGHVSLVRPWVYGGAVQELPKSSRCGPHSRARGSEKKIDKKTSNHMEKNQKLRSGLPVLIYYMNTIANFYFVKPLKF